MILKTIIFANVIAFGGLPLFMNNEQRFRFSKPERITGEKRVDSLFARGISFISYPFRVVYLNTEQKGAGSLSILITVPKKKIRLAVNRNRIKRLAREAYRLNKHLFVEAKLIEDKAVDVAFIYVPDKPCNYASVEKGICKALKELSHRIEDKKECLKY